MTAQLTEILQDVLREVGGHEVPSTFVSNTNQTASQILAIANHEGRFLIRKHAWEVLVTPYTFTTVSGTNYYPLPSDFQRILNATWWDRTQSWPLRGPLSAAQWQADVSRSAQFALKRSFSIFGGKFYLFPTPTSTGDTISFSYVSKNWVVDSTGAAKASFTADTDSPAIDDHLLRLGVKWRYLLEKGLPSELALQEYQAAVSSAMGSDGGAPQLNMRGECPTAALAVTIPDGDFG